MGPRFRLSRSSLGLAVLVLGLIWVSSASAQTPGTIAGETLSATPGSGYDAQGNCLDPGQCVQATPTCDPANNSTVNFTAVGSAVGPYPGTFTASGTVTFGPQTLPSFTGVVPSPAGPNITLTESFTIHSGTITITGTKQLAADVISFVPGTGVGACGSLPGGYYASDEASATYTAVITDSSGSHTETGNTELNFSRSSTTDCGSAPVCNYGNFAEAFYTATTQPAGAATVTLSPPDAVNSVGTSHTVTATATDSSAQPVQGITILFRVSGADNTSGQCTTDSGGQCSFTYQGPSLPGADLITGCADNNNNRSADPGEPCGTATKAWVVPTSTAGQVTGGGQVPNATGNDQDAFGFTAKNDSRGPKGECTVVDPSPSRKIKCLDVTALVVSGTHATFFGDATVNGQATTYRIDVDDNAEPGKGRDTFKIQTASGYTAGGTLTAGNVQVH